MDTIAALSTAPGAAGLSVIRISGSDALAVLGRVFRSANTAHPIQMQPRKMVCGSLLGADGSEIDRPMAVWFKGPHSFTGEDVCEIHCHGSPALISLALAAIYNAGARPAKPGEFTKRAFLAGKLDLVEAEAIGELIAAETEAAVRNAAALLGGALGRALGGVYDSVLALVARFRAVTDYPEEDITEQEIPEMCSALTAAAGTLSALERRSLAARAFTHGVDCAIVGRPNAGKSSLMNLLCGEDRAIVTPLAGTTRDVVESRAMLGGVPLRLMDTAGIRDSQDPVEAQGILRAKAAAEHASLALLVLDAGIPVGEEDLRAIDAARRAEKMIIVVNKCDLPDVHYEVPAEVKSTGAPVVYMSALSGDGFDELEQAIRTLYDSGELRFNGDVVTSARQLDAICQSRAALLRAADALNSGFPPDMALTDAEFALDKLSELFGRKASEDIVEHIFENFCVGK